MNITIQAELFREGTDARSELALHSRVSLSLSEDVDADPESDAALQWNSLLFRFLIETLPDIGYEVNRETVDEIMDVIGRRYPTYADALQNRHL